MRIVIVIGLVAGFSKAVELPDYMQSSELKSAIAHFKKRPIEEQQDLKGYVLSARILESGVKNGSFQIHVKAKLKEWFYAWTGGLSKSSVAIYKDGALYQELHGKRENSVRVESDKGGNYTDHVTYDYLFIEDQQDGKAHDYVVGIRRHSMATGYPCCLIWYQNIGTAVSEKKIKKEMKDQQYLISVLRSNIAKAVPECMKKAKQARMELDGLTDKKARYEKIMELSRYRRCEVNDLAMGKIWLADAQDKIRNYQREIKKTARKLIPEIYNYDDVEKQYIGQFDPQQIEKAKSLHQDLLAKVDTLSPTGELPSWVESLGFSQPKSEDPAVVKEWRERIKSSLNTGWLSALATGDTGIVYGELKDHLQHINRFRDASRLAADASYEQIVGNQQLVNDVVSSIPAVGDVVDIYAALRGEDLAGNKLTWIDYVAMFGLDALGGMKKGVKKVAKHSDKVDNIVKTVNRTSDAVKEKIAQKTRTVVEKFKSTNSIIKDKITRARVKKKIKASQLEVAKTPKAIKSMEVSAAAKKEAKKKIDLLENALKSGDEKQVKKALSEFYTDKTAKGMVKNGSKETQEKIVDKLEGYYKQVDKKTADAIKTDKNVMKKIGAHVKGENIKHQIKYKGAPDDVLKKFDSEVVDIKARSISGNQAKRLGMDRDVTYVAVLKNGQEVEIPYHYMEKEYQKNFAETFTGKKMSAKEAAEFSDEMDQAITSKLHPEAYPVSDSVPIDDLLKGKNLPHDMETFEYVVTHKVEHYFEKAHKAKLTDPATYAKELGEGMRQATKQYDRMIKSQINVPVELDEMMQMMKDVGKTVNGKEMTAEMVEMSMKKTFGKTPIEAIKEIVNISHKQVNGSRALVAEMFSNKSFKGLKKAVRVSNNVMRRERAFSNDEFLAMRDQAFNNAIKSNPKIQSSAISKWLKESHDLGEITTEEYTKWKGELQ
jgi:hypothetical protein